MALHWSEQLSKGEIRLSVAGVLIEIVANKSARTCERLETESGVTSLGQLMSDHKGAWDIVMGMIHTACRTKGYSTGAFLNGMGVHISEAVLTTYSNNYSSASLKAYPPFHKYEDMLRPRAPLSALELSDEREIHLEQGLMTLFLEGSRRYESTLGYNKNTRPMKTGIVEYLISARPLSGIDDYVSEAGSESDTLRLALDLNLLTQTSRRGVYPFTGEEYRADNRVKFLRFADEFEATLKDLAGAARVMSNGSTLGHLIELWQISIGAIKGAKAWGVYDQSPWVTGYQTAQLLHWSYNKGLSEFYLQIGGVLTIYNIIRHFTDMAPMPWLENFLTAFGPMFTQTSPPPKANFRNCWCSFLGGRAQRLPNGKWVLDTPEHTRFSTMELAETRMEKQPSLFHDVMDSDCDPTMAESFKRKDPRLHGSRDQRERMPVFDEPFPSDHVKPDYWSSFDAMQIRMSQEFEGEFPLARLNILKLASTFNMVLYACSPTVTDMGLACVDFVELICDLADDGPSTYAGRGAHVDPFILKCRDLFEKLLRPLKIDEYLWKNV